MSVFHVFISGPNPCFLYGFPVIIFWRIRVPLQMIRFLSWSPFLSTYSWAPSCPSVVESWCVTCVKRVAQKLGGGCIWMVEFAQVCVKIFWRDKFIAPRLIPNPIPSLVLGSIREFESELRGASGSMISQPRLRFCR